MVAIGVYEGFLEEGLDVRDQRCLYGGVCEGKRSNNGGFGREMEET